MLSYGHFGRGRKLSELALNVQCLSNQRLSSILKCTFKIMNNEIDNYKYVDNIFYKYCQGVNSTHFFCFSDKLYFDFLKSLLTIPSEKYLFVVNNVLDLGGMFIEIIDTDLLENILLKFTTDSFCKGEREILSTLNLQKMDGFFIWNIFLEYLNRLSELGESLDKKTLALVIETFYKNPFSRKLTNEKYDILFIQIYKHYGCDFKYVEMFRLDFISVLRRYYGITTGSEIFIELFIDKISNLNFLNSYFTKAILQTLSSRHIDMFKSILKTDLFYSSVKIDYRDYVAMVGLISYSFPRDNFVEEGDIVYKNIIILDFISNIESSFNGILGHKARIYKSIYDNFESFLNNIDKFILIFINSKKLTNGYVQYLLENIILVIDFIDNNGFDILISKLTNVGWLFYTYPDIKITKSIVSLFYGTAFNMTSPDGELSTLSVDEMLKLATIGNEVDLTVCQMFSFFKNKEFLCFALKVPASLSLDINSPIYRILERNYNGVDVESFSKLLSWCSWYFERKTFDNFEVTSKFNRAAYGRNSSGLGGTNIDLSDSINFKLMILYSKEICNIIDKKVVISSSRHVEIISNIIIEFFKCNDKVKFGLALNKLKSFNSIGLFSEDEVIKKIMLSENI